MSSYTPNLNLEKPEYKSSRSDLPINSNFDLIDAALTVKSNVPVTHYKLTGTTASTQGGNSQIVHGQTLSKIISCSALVFTFSNAWEPKFTTFLGYEYEYYISLTEVKFLLSSSSSASILSMPITVYLTVED